MNTIKEVVQSKKKTTTKKLSKNDSSSKHHGSSKDKVLLIGAGGTGGYLALALSKTYNLIVADGDVYEEKNLNRQPLTIVGQNKAKRIKDITPVIAYDKYLTGNEDFEGVTLIISAVDNDRARRSAMQIAQREQVPLIICQNEMWNPMAWLCTVNEINSLSSPYHQYNLANLDVSGSKYNCSGVLESTDEVTQTASANLASAGLVMMIINSMKAEKEDNWLREIECVPHPIWKTIKQAKETK